MKQKNEHKNTNEVNQVDDTLTMRMSLKQARELLSDLEKQRDYIKEVSDYDVDDSIIVLIYSLKAKLDSSS